MRLGAAWDTPSHPLHQPGRVQVRLLLFPTEAADRARVASMPDTTWPIGGHPPGSSRDRIDTPVPMSSLTFDTSTAIRLRSPSRSPPDTLTGAFSSSFTTTVFSQRSTRWFGTSRRRAVPKGHTFISHTAPHQEPRLHDQAPLSAFVAHQEFWNHPARPPATRLTKRHCCATRAERSRWVGNDSLDVLLCRRWRTCGPPASPCGGRRQTTSSCVS